MQIGASFSHQHLNSLGIDPNNAIKEFKSLCLNWIRLSCYWNELEPEQGKLNFTQLDQLVRYCQKNKINVLLTVGVKAQRYPEWYIPQWAHINLKITPFYRFKKENQVFPHAINFLERVIKHYKKYSCIKVWQVENEPLDASGPNLEGINTDFLKEEIKLVRKLDPKRKILVNFLAIRLSVLRLYRKVLPLIDIIGIDIYLRRPVYFLKFFTKYIGTLDSKETMQSIAKEIKDAGKKFWITELQTEPWEPGEIVTAKENPPSFLPQHFEENIKYALSLEPKVILLWGFEYWLWRKIQGDNRYIEAAKTVIEKYS